MKRAMLSSWIETRIRQYREERLKLLRQIQFSDLLKSRSFLSGEISVASDFVHHRLDEYFSQISADIFQELVFDLTAHIKPDDTQYDAVRRIGYYTYDPEFEEEWLRIQNLFTSEFMKDYVVSGRIAWQKVAELAN